VDLFQLLDGLVQTYPNLQPHKADIRIEPRLPAVLGNEAALTQCFSNLLGNAVKFAKPGAQPHIRIWAELRTPGPESSLESSGSGIPARAPRDTHDPFASASPVAGQPSHPASPVVRIWVEDDGIGIPEHSLQRIFDMFQRATTDQEGTGIGLAIVRKVVERMGGAAGVESQPGQGSRFWVELAKAP
jgi:signal transduction histidine kinase